MNFNFSEQGMDPATDMEIRLWQYIDGDSAESPLIEKLVADNIDWKEKYAELLALHKMIQAADLEEPSLRFTKNVMEEIGCMQVVTAAKKYINTKIIWGIAAFFLAAIVGFLGYGILQFDWSPAGDGGATEEVDFGSIDYSKIFNNTFIKIFLMANVLLGLMLLDRFLALKKKGYLNK